MQSEKIDVEAYLKWFASLGPNKLVLPKYLEKQLIELGVDKNLYHVTKGIPYQDTSRGIFHD